MTVSSLEDGRLPALTPAEASEQTSGLVFPLARRDTLMQNGHAAAAVTVACSLAYGRGHLPLRLPAGARFTTVRKRSLPQLAELRRGDPEGA